MTSTMLGRTFEVTTRQAPERWRTAILSIAGASPVTVALASDRSGCAALAAAMLMIDEDELEIEMIDDFMRELVNMTAGQIKRELALDEALGMPRCLDEISSDLDWTHHVLASESISVIVSLAPSTV
ncbi:MAG TPA: chemotaxis protein CheX [Kofleriaceae bacterium]